MLSGSAVLRVLLLLVAVAGITGVVQVFWLRSPAPTPAPEPARTSAPQDGRRSEPGRAETPPAAPEAAAKPNPTPTPAPAPSAAARPEPVPGPARPLDPPPAPPRAAEPPPPPLDPAEAAAENAPAAAVALLDLNTATLAELNGLKGGGAIGRTIIGHRPYTSVEQLLSKRVLNRATYQRIKDQVMVR
ncbi:ComEA family DNA-binding protein [Methylobacterium sp. Leaf118]|uniref:ComEA family DNA-binding protein n=1 Tax=Methylobacterium sp. Leaf118 TaxID=2876562 RepID=UPI001E4C5181|nr:helix-hairpin-helix domain-containing protein [Methylobacterium sp. Leaf118]